MTATPTAPPPPRDRLVAAARTVVSREGIEGLSLRAIAREANVSHGAPLRHFPSLAALLSALSTWGFRQLTAAVTAAVDAPDAPDAPGDARGRLRRSAGGYLRFALSEPGLFAVMFRSELLDVSDDDYRAAAATTFGQLTELVAAAQAEGWHAGPPADRVAAVLWANVHGLAGLWLHGALDTVVEVDDVGELLDLAADLLAS
jgi:AcrR family transcriptional regulator